MHWYLNKNSKKATQEERLIFFHIVTVIKLYCYPLMTFCVIGLLMLFSGNLIYTVNTDRPVGVSEKSTTIICNIINDDNMARDFLCLIFM